MFDLICFSHTLSAWNNPKRQLQQKHPNKCSYLDNIKVLYQFVKIDSETVYL